MVVAVHFAFVLVDAGVAVVVGLIVLVYVLVAVDILVVVVVVTVDTAVVVLVACVLAKTVRSCSVEEWPAILLSVSLVAPDVTDATVLLAW